MKYLIKILINLIFIIHNKSISLSWIIKKLDSNILYFLFNNKIKYAATV